MFWDSSALVPVLVAEARSVEMIAILRKDAAPAMWWATPVECQSALQRRRREKILSDAALALALVRLERLSEDLDVVAPTARLRESAGRALAAHALRAADALQLAAALAWSADDARGEGFVCLDDRLCEAARREGFEVLPA